MNTQLQSILILHPEAAAREAAKTLFESAGYSVRLAENIDEAKRMVQSSPPDLILLYEDLNQPSSSRALSELKALGPNSKTRLVLSTPGGAAQRAEGFDLGADDVLPAAWDDGELLARVRAQLRQKATIDQFEEKSRIAEESREVAQTAFQALAVTEKMTRDAFSLERALKIGVGSLIAIAVVIAGIFFLFSRRALRHKKQH